MTKQNEKATKQDFVTYQEVQSSGATNMFDIGTVLTLSNLSREKILDIMKNYSLYTKKWGGRKC